MDWKVAGFDIRAGVDCVAVRSPTRTYLALEDLYRGKRGQCHPRRLYHWATFRREYCQKQSPAQPHRHLTICMPPLLPLPSPPPRTPTTWLMCVSVSVSLMRSCKRGPRMPRLRTESPPRPGEISVFRRSFTKLATRGWSSQNRARAVVQHSSPSIGVSIGRVSLLISAAIKAPFLAHLLWKATRGSSWVTLVLFVSGPIVHYQSAGSAAASAQNYH